MPKTPPHLLLPVVAVAPVRARGAGLASLAGPAEARVGTSSYTGDSLQCGGCRDLLKSGRGLQVLQLTRPNSKESTDFNY